MQKSQIAQIAAQIVLVLVMILALGIGGMWLDKNGKDAVSVSTQKKESLLSAEQTNVSFQQVGGRVTEVFVAEGQFVTQGTVLMELDTRDIDLQLEQMRIQTSGLDDQIAIAKASINDFDVNVQQTAIETAQDNLDSIRRNQERIEILYEGGAATEVAVEDAQLKLSVAENTLIQSQEVLQKYEKSLEIARMNVSLIESQKKALQVQIESLQDQKSRRVLVAPADGTVMRVLPKIGENVTANATVLIIQNKSLYFDLYVPETQINRFNAGEYTSVYVVALDKTVPGMVQYINSAPQYAGMRMTRDNAQGDISSFLVRIRLATEDAADLLPGMTVEVLTDAAD